MATSVGSAYVTISPKMEGFSSKVNASFGSYGLSSGKAFSKSFSDSTSSLEAIGSEAGDSFVKSFSNATKQDVVSGLTKQVERAGIELTAAKYKSEVASKTAEAAQAKYNEQVKKYGASSSQAINAEKQLIVAKHNDEEATKRVKTASENLSDAEKKLEEAQKKSEKAFKESSTAADGFSTKMGVLSGAVGGFVASAAQSLFMCLSSLKSEIIETADSSQKFAQTLEFAGLDTSTIDALTKKTQEYADKTVYSLSDVRSITSQLASNGVKDYDRLAEAAGNLNAVAGGTSETYKSVGMVLTQTAGMGKLTTENWNQLSDAIPGASGKLQEAMLANGAYTGNFREAMEKGEITAEEFNEALLQLGFTDVAKQAAESTSTIEGASGNLEATVVGGFARMLQTATPFLTTVINGLNEGLTVAFDVANNAVETFVTSIESGSSTIESLANAFSTLPPEVQAGAIAIGILGGAFVTAKLVSTGKSVASSFKTLGSAISSIAGKASSAAGGLITTGTASKTAGKAVGGSVKQILAGAVAVVALGAGVALAAFGLSMLVQSAIQLAEAGPLAIGVLVGLVGAVAGLAFGASLLGPALTAGALGFVAFGLAVTLVGAGIFLICTGVSTLAYSLPVVSAYGMQAAMSFAALGGALVVLGAGLAVTAVGLTLLGVSAIIAGAGLTVLMVGATLAGVGLTLLAAGVSLVAGGVTLLAGGMSALGAAMITVATSCEVMGSSLPVIASSAPLAASGLTILAGASVAAAGGLGVAVPGLSSLAGASAAAAGGAMSASAGLMALAVAAMLVSTSSNTASTSLNKVSSASSSMASKVASSANSATSAIRSMVSNMQSAVNGMKLTIPRIEVGALPHFSMSGRFDAQTGSVPSISVQWYGSGGFFKRASLIGVGEAGEELNMPLAGRKMKPFSKAVAGNLEDEVTYDESTSSSDVIKWLAMNLPSIISQYTPVMGDSDFDRRARKAVKYV